MPRIAFPLVAVLLVSVSSAQVLRFTIRNPGSSQFFGPIAAAGDVDADGVDDILVGAWYLEYGYGRPGAAYVFSGVGGRELRSFSARSTGRVAYDFGAFVAGVGDVNGDGHADIAVSGFISGAGTQVFSGKDGRELRYHGQGSIRPIPLNDVDGDNVRDYALNVYDSVQRQTRTEVISAKSGATVYTIRAGSEANVGDIDKDGADDLLGFSSFGPPYVAVYSTKTGKVVLSYGTYCRRAAGVGDVNKDGVPDIALAGFVVMPETVRVISGKDTKTLHEWTHTRTPGALAGVGDVNEDGYPDVLVGAPGEPPGGEARLFSGKDGSLIYTLHPSGLPGDYGWEVAGGFDVDRDGVNDIAVAGRGGYGYVDVFVRKAASTVAFGQGCKGTGGVLNIAPVAGSLPRMGKTFEVEVTNLPATARIAFMHVGFSRTGWQALKLPLPLDFIGMTGCTMYTGGDRADPIVVTTPGRAVWSLSTPYRLSFQFYNQALVLDPAANPFGLIASNALENTIGT